jgi:hypothetical protein
MKLPLSASLTLFSFALLSQMETRALTVEQLRKDATITPQTFARHFSNFRFVFRADVQSPEQFLASEAGDCDDYSTLAAAELSARGYHTRLVSVRMENVIHVVCFVAEANGYLDYNKRAKGTGLVMCGPDLWTIADSVAKSFKSSWTSVSEFTYGDGVKRLVATALPKTRLASK